MAVFRNVMAFLGLDDDDQIYDDDAYYEDDEEVVESQPRKRKTIALDDRLPAAAEAPSFGFSADTEMNEMGGVGAVRPLRPVPTEQPPVPEALSGSSERRIHQPGTTGAFEGAEAEFVADAAVDQIQSGSAIPSVPDVEGPAPSSDAATYEAPASPVGPSSSGTNGSGDPVSGSRPSLTAIDGASAVAHRQSQVEEPQNNVVTHAKPRLHIPSSFDDASRVADDFRAGAPVVMNLSKVEKPVARRLVDFASGVCYALTGGMERVAPNVYLLTPVGIDVSPEDRRRMQERGFDR